MGLRRRLSSPVRVDVPSASADTADAILMVVPEFAASMSAGRSPRGVTRSASPSCSISAPRLRQAATVASVSADASTFAIVLGPSAKDARNMARCV